jgi:hypothetical protein
VLTPSCGGATGAESAEDPDEGDETALSLLTAASEIWAAEEDVVGSG